MPRIKSDEERAADVENSANGLSVDTGTERTPRVLRPIPDGVTVGLLDTPVAVSEPVKVRKQGRKVDPKTTTAIELMTATPGQWFELGVFMSNASPTKDSAFGKAGVKFRNVPQEDGTYIRYGSIPATTPAVENTDQG